MGAQVNFTLQPSATSLNNLSYLGNYFSASSPTATIHPSANVSQGSTIVIFLNDSATGVPSAVPTDTQSNVYKLVTSIDFLGNLLAYICFDCNALTTGDTISFTDALAPAGLFMEAAFVLGGNALDATGNGTSSGSSIVVTSTIPTQAGDIFIAWGFDTNGDSLTAPNWDNLVPGVSYIQSLINPDATAETFTSTAANPPWGLIMVAIAGSSSAASVSETFLLNQQGGTGFAMSQICSLQIDNTQNDTDIIVTHGAFNNNVNVVANSMAIVPTYSSQFAYTVKVSSSESFSETFTVPITFLNYPTNYGVFIEPQPTPATVIPNPLNTTGTTAVTSQPNPTSFTPTVQYSSGIGDTQANIAYPIQADFNATATATASGTHAAGTYDFYATLLPAITGPNQGYIFTSFQINAAALGASAGTVGGTVSATVSLGYSDGDSSIGSWTFACGASPSVFTGQVADVDNYYVFTTAGQPIIVSLALTLTSSSEGNILSGSATVAVQGITAPAT